jgi:GDP-4-dehydro-6-deoxy-D-mannose reductase
VAGLPLVTGATGFAGSHLLDDLLRDHGAVAAWSNPGGAAPINRDARVQWQPVDLLDRAAVIAAIGRMQPAVVYHVAGAAHVGDSWADPVRPLRVNTLGTHHVLDAIRLAGWQCPVLVAGSALVYRPSLAALDEEAPLGPPNPYGLSKLAQEVVALRDAWSPVFLARPFNHAGPRQSPEFATSAFAKQIAEIEAGEREPVLHVGNLDARRDIMDVRDTIRGYRMLVERGRPARPYNICRGQAHRVGDMLEMMLGLSQVRIQVAIDPARLRPSDVPLVLGNPARIAAETGWQAAIPIEQTLADLLDYWRQRIAVTRA